METAEQVRWSTNDEIDHLKKLSTWNVKFQRDPDSRKKLLENYKEAMKKRVAWGDIDNFEIECYVEKELALITLEKTS